MAKRPNDPKLSDAAEKARGTNEKRQNKNAAPPEQKKAVFAAAPLLGVAVEVREPSEGNYDLIVAYNKCGVDVVLEAQPNDPDKIVELGIRGGHVQRV